MDSEDKKWLVGILILIIGLIFFCCLDIFVKGYVKIYQADKFVEGVQIWRKN